jgi:zinc ribbon protein
MFCPRCGSQNAETIKFCRQCGLPLQQISSFVASGATGALQHPPAQPAQASMPLLESSEMLALKQKRIMTILAICIAPVMIAILGQEFFKLGDISGIPFLLVPIGIMWAVFRFKLKIRQLEEEQLKQRQAIQQAIYPQSTPQSTFASQPQQAHLPSPETNPLDAANTVPSSVVEDETRKLPVGNH